MSATENLPFKRNFDERKIEIIEQFGLIQWNRTGKLFRTW